MEARDCNRWQSVANRSDPKRQKQARSVVSDCHRLPEKFHGKRLVATACRLPLPVKEGVDFGFAKRSSPANPKARRTRLDTNTD
jgi:hypothetical protein